MLILAVESIGVSAAGLHLIAATLSAARGARQVEPFLYDRGNGFDGCGLGEGYPQILSHLPPLHESLSHAVDKFTRDVDLRDAQ
jgi:hypothetical protein